MTTDYSMRRVVEDRLAARLPGGIPAYRLIPDNELMAMDAVKGRLTTLGFTSVLMLRLAADTSRPTANGTTFYDYWDKWRSAYTPDSAGVNRVYAFETTLYSVQDGRMIWMARSAPMQPTNDEKLKDYSVSFAIDNLRESGYVR